MRERELIRLRAQTILRCYGYEDTRRLKGTARLAYRFLLRGLRQLACYARRGSYDGRMPGPRSASEVCRERRINRRRKL